MSVIGMMSVVLMQECGGKATETGGCQYFERVRVGCMERSHVAVENTGEHQ